MVIIDVRLISSKRSINFPEESGSNRSNNSPNSISMLLVAVIPAFASSWSCFSLVTVTTAKGLTDVGSRV